MLDVSIIHLKKTDLFKSVIPSKLFECMAMGIPVLHGVQGESADIVTKERVGLLFEPENSQELCEVLVRLANNKGELEKFSSHCVVAAKHYSRDVLARRMLSVLEVVASRNADSVTDR